MIVKCPKCNVDLIGTRRDTPPDAIGAYVYCCICNYGIFFSGDANDIFSKYTNYDEIYEFYRHLMQITREHYQRELDEQHGGTYIQSIDEI